MRTAGLSILLPVFLLGCQNLEDAPLSKRDTFVHFYEGAYSLEASSAELTDDGGYIIAGTIRGDGFRNIKVIKTDTYGLKEWETVIKNGSASSIKKTSVGYIVIGQAVELNPFSSDINELENNSARLIKLTSSGSVSADIAYNRKIPKGDTEFSHVDYHGNALTFNQAQTIIFTLGTFKEPGGNEFSYVTALNETTLDTLWIKEYNYIVRDYTNAKSVYSKNGNLFWGTSVTQTNNAFSYSYLAIPVITENSSFINSSYFGQNQEQQSLKIKDFKESLFGYGAIGTYTQPDGTKGNVFFIKIDQAGNFNEQSIRYFDSNHSDPLTNPTESDIDDEGLALAATRDGGFVLAGSIATSPLRGKGGKDIWLIKIDALGNMLWEKSLGGATSEIVSSITETSDGGLLICGTIQDGNAQSGGLSSIFLMKTDKNGELKN